MNQARSRNQMMQERKMTQRRRRGSLVMVLGNQQNIQIRACVGRIVRFCATKYQQGEFIACRKEPLRAPRIPITRILPDFLLKFQTGAGENLLELRVSHPLAAVACIAKHGRVGSPGGFHSEITLRERALGSSFEILILAPLWWKK